MAIVYQDVDKMLKPMSDCTYMRTGLQPSLQKVYFCHDCNPSMNETYCEICIESCHFDHHVSKSKELKTYCFCGKKLHRVVDSVLISTTKECTFWEFDEISKALTGSNKVMNCKECKRKLCSYCVFFCHYHHLDKMVAEKSSDFKGCDCDNVCHKDDRIMFYYMKDFAMFRLENLYNTHMVNLLFECPSTYSKLFGFFSKKIREIQNDIAAGHFKWNRALFNSSSGFSRSLMCLYMAMRNVKLNYFSQTRDELFQPKLVMQICIDNSYDEHYEVRVIKKNLIFLLFKSVLLQDFGRFNKYTASDYSNISCLQRLELYNSVRNDLIIKKKYFNEDFPSLSVKVLEKFANLCRVDDHISMALFATMLSVIKLLMQYGVYNIIQMKMINYIFEILLKSLKLEKVSKANEEYKEMIFKKLPSLLYIMIFSYNDYVFLENLLYSYVDFNEFAVGKSNFGTRLLSSIFLSNVKYLMKYFDSKKFSKILKLTYKSFSMLTSENDGFLKTLFNIQELELVNFVMYYDMLTDSNYNNNFPFATSSADLLTPEVFYHKKFPDLPVRNSLISEKYKIYLDEKAMIETAYEDYFNFKKRSILDVVQLVNNKIGNYIAFIETCRENLDPNKNKGAMLGIMTVLANLNSPSDYKTFEIIPENTWNLSDVHLIMNKTGLIFTIVKILDLTAIQSHVISEDFFNDLIKLLKLYTKDSVANTTNILSSCFLKSLFLYLNKFPHLILKFIYDSIKFLKNSDFNLSDYSQLYDTLKDSFNCKYTKLEDAERYIQGFIYHMKCLKAIKYLLPANCVTDMNTRIRDFLERLMKSDNGLKEYFWVNNFKVRLFMKDSEYQNLIDFEKYLEMDRQMPKEEKAKFYGQSEKAKQKKLIRETKRKMREDKIVRRNRDLFDNKSDFLRGDDTMNISVVTEERREDPEDIVIEKIDDEMLLDQPSFVSELTIDNDEIVKKQKPKSDLVEVHEVLNESFGGMHYHDQVKKSKRENKKSNDTSEEISLDLFMLENVKNMKMLGDGKDLPKLIPNNLPSIDENNFDNSMIKIEDDLHQEMNFNNEAVEKIEDKVKTGGILSPLVKEENSFLDNSELGVSEIFGNPMMDKNEEGENGGNLIDLAFKEDENYIYQINFTEEQNIELEKEVFADINNISPELFENKKLRTKNLSKNKKELIKIRKLKAIERKQVLLEKVMRSKNTAKAFVNLLEMINIFTEDFTSSDLQEIIRRYFPRTDINNILEQKRYVKDLKLRSEIIKMLRINYLNIPISKEKSYFDLFYLNEYDFFIQLYERNAVKNSRSKLTNIEKIANILIYELHNFEEIVSPLYEAKQYEKNKYEKNMRAVKHFITEGLLNTMKIFADKVYSHGQHMTGSELCLAYKIIFHFINVKPLLDSLLQGYSLNDGLSLARKKENEEENEIEILFHEDKGGIENFNRQSLFKLFYRSLTSSLVLADPEYKKSVNDVWFSLNRRINNVGIYDGIDYLPNMLDKITDPKKIGKYKDIKILNEYSKICKYYLAQSKNFIQSPILACFNCIVHESDFNYRETFFKFFCLSFTNETLRKNGDNCLLEIMNRCLEYDHERLHPIILKHLKSEESDKKEKLFNELNRQLLYNMIILFVYVNRQDSYNIWDLANYYSCQIVRFLSLLAKNPTTLLHDFILKHSHKQGDTLSYNFFILLEALMNKVIKLSKWGREYDLKNEIFFDNMYVIFHTIVNCLSDYAREADTEGVFLVYSRIKKMIYGLKKIMFYESSDIKDIIFEIKLSILHLINSILEEGKAGHIVSEISFYFDPYKMFKLCVSIFKMEVARLLKNPTIKLVVPAFTDYNDIQLNLRQHLPQLLRVYQQEEIFNESKLLNLCNKIFFYIKTLKDVYKDPNAVKCFYAINRYKNTLKKLKKTEGYNHGFIEGKRTIIDYKYLHETGTLVDTFLEMDEITETEYVIYKFLKNILGVVEVFSYREKLEYVYFPKIPLTYYLHIESLERFVENFYERDLNYTKIKALDTFINQAIEECYYSYHLEKTNIFLGLLDRGSHFLYYKIIVCIINAFICALNWVYIDNDSQVFQKLAYAFDMINFIFMVGLLALWLTVRYYPRYKQKQLSYMKSKKHYEITELKFYRSVWILIWDICICDFDFLYLSSTAILSFFSLITSKATLKFFQLVNFIILSNNLWRLMTFVSKHLFEMFLLLVMLFILLGAFAAMSHDFFNMFKEKEDGTTDFCKNFTNCMFQFIFYGLRYDSGITEALLTDWKSDIYKDLGNVWKRIVLDVGFHMLIKGMWLSLLIAIFINAYLDYKHSQQLLNYDSINRCYICHLDRDVFHKYKMNFNKHVNNEHKILNYFYFIIYVLTKNPQNLSKIEKFVLDKFRISNFEWIPSKDTTALQEKVRKIQEDKTRITSEYNLGRDFQKY